MTRLFLASITVISVLAEVASAGETQKPTPKKDPLPHSNQVYVKIIMPIDPVKRDKDLPVVEAWIAEQLKKGGQSKFTAATAWVPLVEKRLECTSVWDGNLKGMQSICPVAVEIVERANGRIKLRVDGWAPVSGFGINVSLTDEPGSNKIAAVEKLKDDSGMPYVVVLIGPPPEKPVAPSEHKK